MLFARAAENCYRSAMQIPAQETLSASLYRDPGIFEKERRAIFAKSWLLFAHESQFAQAGSYVAQTVAGFPLIAVKGEDGIIRAFHNVCRHRAGPLARDGAGHCDKQLTCLYHGWRYALDGRLANARDFGPAAGFDPRDFALFPVKCESWRGFIFVNLDGNAGDFEAQTAALEARMQHLPLGNLRKARTSTHDMRCNWKTYVENYLEGYHIPVLHPSLSASLARDYGTELKPPAIFYHATPADGAAVAGLWAWLWPCLGVNVYADGILMERMWPLDYQHTRLDYLFLFTDEASDADIAKQVQQSLVTTAEDIFICEAVQKNLDSGIYETGRLSPRHESGVAWFQHEVARAIGN